MNLLMTSKRLAALLPLGFIALTSFAVSAQEKSAHEKNPLVMNKVANQANPAAGAILGVVEQLRNAIKAGDAAMAERSMAENILIFEQGHAEKSRAEYLGHHFKEDVVFAKAVPSKVVSSQVQVDGAMALVTAYSTTDGTFKDRPVKNAGVETYVLRLRGDTWLIEHIHWSSSKRP